MERRRVAVSRALLALTSVALATLGACAIGCTAASADAALSSIVLSEVLPGMVAAPPGSFNGPLTQSEVQSWGGDSGATSALAQALGNGEVNGYLRQWRSDPPNGAFVQILAAQMPSSGGAAYALGGADRELSGSPSGQFSVPEIAGARGYTATTNTPSGVVTEDVVSFAKGSILFEVTVGQVTTAANSGAPQLSQDDAIQIASRQAAVAPGPLTNPTYVSGIITINLAELLGAGLVVGGLVWLVIFLVRRSNRANQPVPLAAYWESAPGAEHLGFPPPPAVPGTSAGHGVASAPGRTGTVLLERPPVARQPGFFCSWCGTHVEIGASVRHDCGPRDRPTAYCMGCGGAFAEGSTVCAACGNPRLQ
jgi:hypothetical protein